MFIRTLHKILYLEVSYLREVHIVLFLFFVPPGTVSTKSTHLLTSYVHAKHTQQKRQHSSFSSKKSADQGFVERRRHRCRHCYHYHYHHHLRHHHLSCYPDTKAWLYICTCSCPVIHQDSGCLADLAAPDTDGSNVCGRCTL